MASLTKFKSLPLEKKKLVLKKLDNAYYNKNESPVDDYTYDQMKDIILSEDPNYTSVGATIQSTFAEARHDFPMLSMDKASASKDTEDNEKALKKLLNLAQKTKGIVVDWKVDGLSLSLIYKNGKLFRAATRGDGVLGEDVTENAKVIKGVPHTIDHDGDVEVRGEVCAKLSTFEKINEKLAPADRFKNARNYASGSLRQKDVSIVKQRELSFIAFSVIGKELKSYKEESTLLKELGFETLYSFSFGSKDFNLGSLDKITKHFAKKRDSLDFLVDGIIFKAYYFDDREKLGENDKFPKWAVAWKFLPVERQTVLLGIDWSVGKTGKITPCAKIKPVDVDGSTIDHPTLHNRKKMEELGLKIGATVTVCKAGDVIPQIVSSMGGQEEIKYPETCPCCGEDLTYEDIYIMCYNPECEEKLLGQLQTMADAMAIEEFGDATRKQVVRAGFIHNVFDMFRLTKEDLLTLDGFKEKSASKVIDNIQSADKTPIKLLTGLVIAGVSKSTFEKLFTLNDLYGFVDDVITGDLEKYRRLEGIGDFVINSLSEYGSHSAPVLRELVRFYEENGTEVSTKLQGLAFAITGALSVGRKEIENTIELNGGKVGGVNKKTNYLICNEKSSSSKTQKAEKYGVAIITEEQFLELLEKGLE